MEITRRELSANGLDFTLMECGTGPLALCLHGFPDTAHTWRHLLPALAEAGFHAVAPFMRGYAPTAVPSDGCYQTGALVADALALHEALEADGDAVIIGHDWGALAAYGAVAHEPDRWRRAVTAAVPPPASMADAFFSYDQIKRSFYMFFFQTPLAEMALQLGDLAFIARLWADWSPGYDAADDVAHVRSSLRDPANIAAAIGYYRAMFDPTNHRYSAMQASTANPPPVPTLYLHGADDGCLGMDLTGDVARHLPTEGSRFEAVPGAGHFLHLEKPADVNGLIIEFVSA